MGPGLFAPFAGIEYIETWMIKLKQMQWMGQLLTVWILNE